ncbi:ArsC/Spx/MgsR family protein [Pricia sp. S334]|uniref:ArsC/Spx/MgsR family protein n=1 Tax=Pricia mediterranea TaxID=3076079 RepID=A0ABU3L5P4_9FLAO|nr:ArsC/Spx/MgsR family protein [Pricia sp. S334]MDT7829061.1 ArsC/Spx/MgsR family protein [Pricia sp. S334]
MKKIYHLGTCNTCQRILKELQPVNDLKLQDIKTKNITESQLNEMKGLAGSYEALFSRRARLYREKGLHEKELSETDYKNLILKHYTFLKRPVIIVNDQIFIGNSKKTAAWAREALQD